MSADGSSNERVNLDRNGGKAKGIWLIAASIASAVAATFCCLPALVFLIFGASFTLLSSEAIESLTALRPYFTAFAVICFAASGIYFFKKPKACGINTKRKKWILIYAFLAFFVIVLLSYPEILGALYA